MADNVGTEINSSENTFRSSAADHKELLDAPDENSAAGKPRKVHPEYSDPDADLIIVSSDEVDFHVDSFYLKAASMLKACEADTSKKIELVDPEIETSRVVKLLMNLICGRPYPILDDLNTFLVLHLIRLAQKYECTVALSILELSVLQPTLKSCGKSGNPLSRFFWACQLDHADGAQDFLPAAARRTWILENGNAPQTVHDNLGDASALDLTSMGTKYLDALPRKYFLALLRASRLRAGSDATKRKWEEVAKDFREQVRLQDKSSSS